MMKEEFRGRVPPPGEPAKGELTEEIKGDVPHSGVREALLAPMVAPALPDAVRSSSSSFKNQNSTIINRQFFLCHADGDKWAGRGGPALPF
jgi:hypothetical protein